MPRAVTKRGRPRQVEMQYFIFETTNWKPHYSLSVNYDKYAESPYREYVGIDIDAPCVFPGKLVGRSARISIFGERDHMAPPAFQKDSDWRPRCIGGLELTPSRGEFYMSVPMDSLPVLMAAMAHGLIRYVLLWGPPLFRSKSLCTSVHFEKEVDLNDY